MGTNAFSIRYDDKLYNKILFAFGDMSKWIIFDKATFNKCVSPSSSCSEQIHISKSNPGVANGIQWNDGPEFPMISIDASNLETSTVYFENIVDESLGSLANQGANVWINEYFYGTDSEGFATLLNFEGENWMLFRRQGHNLTEWH